MSETLSPNCLLVIAVNANDSCDWDTSICGDKLQCMSCTEDSIQICVSGDHYILLFVDFCCSGCKINMAAMNVGEGKQQYIVIP